MTFKRASRKLISAVGTGVFSVTAFFGSIDPAHAQAKKFAETLGCETGAPKLSDDGKLRLAFLVGIDDYQANADLKGPVNDVASIYRLLTDDGGKKFPKVNICVLTNAEATYSGFKAIFEKALVERAEGAEQVVVYYAGHGSQLVDDNGDEPDGYDETLFLHDSRPARFTDMALAQLRDDEFNVMLGRLHAKTPNLVVIMDSCHSGTATRGRGVARFVRPDPSTLAAAARGEAIEPSFAVKTADGEGAPAMAEFTPKSFPGAVFLSAARDRELAVELDGYSENSLGEFTRSLVSVLKGPDRATLTYNQLIARVQAELATTTGQTPVVSGEGAYRVFTKDIPYQPRYDWRVGAVNGARATITGAPTFGVGKGAGFLIFPDGLSTAQAADPQYARARMRAIDSPSSNVWRLETITSYNKGSVSVGDWAQLVLPAPDARKLRVRVRPSSEPGGVPNSEAVKAGIAAALPKVMDGGVTDVITFVDSGFDFELTLNARGGLQIIDPRGRPRNAYKSNGSDSSDITHAAFDLANHLQQLTLLTGWKLTGGRMVPNKTLEVRLQPIALPPDQGFCKTPNNSTDWPKPANTPQTIPLCAAYEIRAKLAKDAPADVIIGGAVLSANGKISILDGLGKEKHQRLELERGSGGEQTLGRFQATPDSLVAEEYIFVLALPAKQIAGGVISQIPWNQLETPVWGDGKRGDLDEFQEAEQEYGTYTIVPLKTVANPGFGEETAEKISKPVATREYTIPNFDLSPYLPDDQNSALHKVLKIAETLTNVGGTGDGAPYKQHAWCEGSEASNLAKGIDCSRSIWYAFTRAGVPYNRYANGSTPIPETMCASPYDPTKDGYLYTGDMARKDYLMSDEFDDCLAPSAEGVQTFKLGDILVYRDKEKGDGHTVMVIDPDERIAWGSHGWDGNPKFLDAATNTYPAADLGVEFQKIKIKKDWERWDRGTMKLAACWRSKTFEREAKSARGLPGLAALCQTLRPGTPFYQSSICSILSDAE